MTYLKHGDRAHLREHGEGFSKVTLEAEQLLAVQDGNFGGAQRTTAAFPLLPNTIFDPLHGICVCSVDSGKPFILELLLL